MALSHSEKYFGYPKFICRFYKCDIKVLTILITIFFSIKKTKNNVLHYELKVELYIYQEIIQGQLLQLLVKQA